MGYRPGDSTYEFEAKIEVTTAKAYLVHPTIGPEQIWVPKSQIANMSEMDGDGNVMFEVTEWWAMNSEMKDYR
jgi:hypothetical protein